MGGRINVFFCPTDPFWAGAGSVGGVGGRKAGDHVAELGRFGGGTRGLGWLDWAGRCGTVAVTWPGGQELDRSRNRNMTAIHWLRERVRICLPAWAATI